MLWKVSWRIFFILISCGTIAYSVYSYLDSLQQTVTVVVASKDIPAHTVLKADMLKKETVEINAATTLLVNPIYDEQQAIGGITLTNISAGRPIELDPKLLIFPEKVQLYLNYDGKLDVTYFIPKEKRLITLALSPDSAVNNRLKSGDWVDVIVTKTSSGLLNEESYANMILQQIEVFDVEELKLDQSNSIGKQGVIQHVTLLVHPQDAVILALAKKEGEIDLILNPWNGEKTGTIPIYNNQLKKINISNTPQQKEN